MARKQKISGLMAFEVEEIARAWKELCDKNVAVMGDSGSCVIGAGIECNGVMIVDAHSVCSVQGSCVWERGLTDLLKELSAKYGKQLRYNCGMLD